MTGLLIWAVVIATIAAACWLGDALAEIGGLVAIAAVLLMLI